MRRGVVSASTPTRIDLAGGTLDIWPLCVLVRAACTVNVGIELRAHASLAPRRDDRIVVISRDRGRRATRRLPLRPRDFEGPLSLPLRLAAAFGPLGGVTLSTRARAPAGAGLGGSSALGIAVGAAFDRFTGSRLSRAALLRRVMNVETEALGVPTGNQDYLAALNGGLAVYLHGSDGTRRRKIRVPAGLERRLVLAYTGQPRHSGFSNWDMFRRFVDAEAETVRRMEAIASIAGGMRDALEAGDLEEAGRLLGEEGTLRYRLAPSVATPALRRADAAARSAGALGVKVCGAGGGGCLVAFAGAGRTLAVKRALAAAGAKVLACRIARRGLEVSGP